MRDGADPLSLRVMYAIAGAAAWLVFRLFRLRHRVIRDNLARSFPDWPASQLASVEREFVRRQGEVLAELFHTQRLAVEELRSRVRLANPELLANASPGRPVILVGAHHCNSEWTFQRMALEYGERFVALYKPIRNPRVDAWMLRLRTRFGARLSPAKSVLM
jgi:KDO2-lipid IV(A) lauroyltransferase